MIEHADFLLRRAVPALALGVAGAGLMGWIGARGRSEGVTAGMGAMVSGPSGMFSGAVLGGLAGAGAMALATVNPRFRHALAAGAASIIRSNPVQEFFRMTTSLADRLPGAELRTVAAERVAAFGRLPQAAAMRSLADYLSRKQAKRYAAGAFVGAVGGAAIGGPMGMLRRAYAAGEQS